MVTEKIFYLTLIVTSVLGILLGVVSFLFLGAIKKFKSKEQNDKADIPTGTNPQLEAAAQNAQQIIQSAHLKAEKILEEAQILNSENQKKIDQLINGVLQKEDIALQKIMQDIRSSILKQVSNVPQSLTSEIKSLISQIGVSVSGEIQKSQQELRARLLNESEKVSKDLDNYKLMMQQKVDERVFEIVKKVSVKVLGKSLSMEEQKDIILKALEDAKQENVL